MTDWAADCVASAEALPEGVAQAILDDVRAGQSIGEARRKHDVSLAAVCGVINRNIQTREFLGAEDVG